MPDSMDDIVCTHVTVGRVDPKIPFCCAEDNALQPVGCFLSYQEGSDGM